MAIRNKQDLLISYDSTEIIEDLKIDIQELGTSFKTYAICKERNGVEIIIDYYVKEYTNLKEIVLNEAEYIKEMTSFELLRQLNLQNSII